MINKVILIGHVGKDPEVRHLDNNASVARFTLATSESYKNKNGERITNTDWHNLIAWRAQADLVGKYVKKGSLLYIEGKIHSRSWNDKDGVKRYTTEIDVETFKLLGPRPEEGVVSQGNSYSDSSKSVSAEDSFLSTERPASSDENTTTDDDLPF